MDDPLLATPISPLRQRLIDDMNVRRFSPETKRNYIRDVGRFATFLGRSPGTATAEDLHRFQVEQREAGVPVPTMNSIVSALRFFFTHTLDRPDLARRLVRVMHPRKMPAVLSPDEVARLLNATTCLKHQAALSVAYGAGLRVAEVSTLKVSDIDSERMLLRVERGKGGAVSQRHALGGYARPAAPVVEGRSTTRRDASERLAVSRPACRQADQHPATYRIVVEAARAADIAKRVRPAYAAPQLRDPSAGARTRYSHDPGVARNGYIVPTNSRLKPVSATGSIRASAKWCRSDDGSKPAASSSSSCSNPTAHSPACRHG